MTREFSDAFGRTPQAAPSIADGARLALIADDPRSRVAWGPVESKPPEKPEPLVPITPERRAQLDDQVAMADATAAKLKERAEYVKATLDYLAKPKVKEMFKDARRHELAKLSPEEREEFYQLVDSQEHMDEECRALGEVAKQTLAEMPASEKARLDELSEAMLSESDDEKRSAIFKDYQNVLERNGVKETSEAATKAQADAVAVHREFQNRFPELYKLVEVDRVPEQLHKELERPEEHPDARARLVLARELCAAGDKSEAKKYLQDALKLYPAAAQETAVRTLCQKLGVKTMLDLPYPKYPEDDWLTFD